MGSPLAFHDFKRKFDHFGVNVHNPRKSSHIKMSKVIDGKKFMYLAVLKNNRVDYLYVQKARKRFRLTAKWGVTDEHFRKA